MMRGVEEFHREISAKTYRAPVWREHRGAGWRRARSTRSEI
jgi:hypothetical protein